MELVGCFDENKKLARAVSCILATVMGIAYASSKHESALLRGSTQNNNAAIINENLDTIFWISGTEFPDYAVWHLRYQSDNVLFTIADAEDVGRSIQSKGSAVHRR